MVLEIVKRDQWNARFPKDPPSSIHPTSITLHYSSEEIDETGDQAKRVLAIQRYHMDNRGWNDIAYNFLVSLNGTVYEGRGWDIRSAAQGGTGEGNATSLAVCLLADDDEMGDLTDKAKASILALLNEFQDRYGSRTVYPHSHWHATSCPGQYVSKWIVDGLPFSIPPEPAPAPVPVPPDVVEPTIRRGATGAPVRLCQARLEVHGFRPADSMKADGSWDGIFGRGVENAVRAFQESRKLTVDGIVGPHTWAALLA